MRPLAWLPVLFLAGCVSIPNGQAPSKVPDGATVTIGGKVTTPGGANAPGTKVTLLKDYGLDFTELTRAANGSSQIAREAKTDDRGDYKFELPGSETKNAYKEPLEFLVYAEREDQAYARTRIFVNETAIGLSPLAFWEGLAVTDAGLQGLAWKAPAAAPKDYSVRVTRPGTGGAVLAPADLVWEQRTTDVAANLPAYLFEDGGKYNVSVRANYERGDTGTPTKEVTAAANATAKVLKIARASSDGKDLKEAIDGALSAAGVTVQDNKLVLDLGAGTLVGHLVLYQYAAFDNRLQVYAAGPDDELRNPVATYEQTRPEKLLPHWLDLNLNNINTRYLTLVASDPDQPKSKSGFRLAEVRAIAP